jgi:signal transduction histidine kinase
MAASRSRVSRRHLLALCTFLVPLLVLAWLGQSELQRQGSAARDALEREARTFLQSAAQALEPQFERVPAVVARAHDRLATEGALRTVLWLREQEGHAALLDIVLLDDSSALVWPEPPLLSLGLPFARDARPRGNETAITNAMQAADLYLTTGRLPQAIEVLEALIARFEEANPPNARTGRRDLDEPELAARFQLATAQRALGDHAAARAEYERVRAAAANLRRVSGGAYSEPATLGLLAEAALAELGSSSDRVKLLRQIAESRREAADGVLSALANRLVERIPAADPLRAEALQLLVEERQRAQTRSFAGDYDSILKSDLRRRLLRQRQSGLDTTADLQLISTFGRTTTMFWVHEANEEERTALRCARIGLHFDLGQLLAPALPQLVGGAGNFVLSITDPADVAMVPPPNSVPEDFVAPVTEVHGLTLRAWPANTERLIADAQAAQRNRTLLFLALFMTVLGGALWLWRSVSREAELAALKVDLVSRVSHELKTPLALIRMYGETLGLGRARDGAQAAQFGHIIARESERLTSLIQRILDFSQQQAGTLRYDLAPANLSQLVRSVCEAYTPHLEARGAILIDSIQPDIEVVADANAASGALVNLLENAAKYGIEGDDEHEIELDLSRQGATAVLEVRDRGRGIPAGEEERIFEGFYRASNAGEVRGAGLGLSLVRHFARAHGGEITAFARPEGGSIFRLVLPLAPAAAGATPPESPAQQTSRS